MKRYIKNTFWYIFAFLVGALYMKFIVPFGDTAAVVGFILCVVFLAAAINTLRRRLRF